ncbi:YqaJ viral recombinase family protein [Borrelia turcica]|uniref:YqaJ viral recombinase family protein n=1 Tax=Borrelia turcica TaxID=229155 RepID=UPI00237BC9B0|nr:YqaJ viral recombinase family protein [Borrelia turcica]
MGASEVANIFTGERDLAQVMITILYKAFGKQQQDREETLGMKKGKLLENLGFEELTRLHGDAVQALYKNKYSNGIDKYNYFKKIDGADNLVGATIDGWFINNCEEAELLEIKCSDKNHLAVSMYGT